MASFQRYVVCIILLVTTLLFADCHVSASPQATAAHSWSTRGDEIVHLVRDNFYDRATAQNWATKQKGYAATIRSESAFVAATQKALAELHASHTAYYTRQQSEYYGLISIFGGILKIKPVLRESPGADFTTDHFVRVVFAGGPAAQAGLRRGDKILQADGKPFDPVVSFQGKADQPVRLNVERTAGKTPFTITITPRRINAGQEWLEAQQKGTRLVTRHGKSVVYVPFFCGAGEQYQTALEEALTTRFANADALVLDFRNGWGGCDPRMINLFSRAPALLEYTDREGKHPHYDSQWRKPVILLINGGSRSGKEVVAHSLQREKRGTLVGERTAGAVLAGRCFALSDGSLLYLAVTDVRVDGTRLEGKGVTPDVSVADMLPYANGADAQWEQAIETATQ